MRRTTQWAVFTSMNQQQPAWRSLYEPVVRAERSDSASEPSGSVSAQVEAEPGTAPDTRRDRVDFM